MAYSGVYVFGDSLVDGGNALKLAQWYGNLTFSDLPEGAPSASDGYFLGRFSNGYVFSDLISNKTIGQVTKPVFPYGYEDPWLGIPIAPFASDPTGNNLNFAYGGAQIRNGKEVEPDLDGQTDAFKDAVDNHAPSGALYLITMGGNDVRSLAPSGSAPSAVSDAHSALDKCADQLINELGQLISIGAKNLLITGVPDVGLIPDYDKDGNGFLDAVESARSAAATQYSQYLDTLIRTEVIPALQARGANVTYVPLMDYTDASGSHVTGALNANMPMLAALNGLTADELSQNLLQHRSIVFFDDVHPNAQAEALLSAFMYSQLTSSAWVETMPLLAANVDYSSVATIAAAGEVDQVTIAMIAGSTYTFQLLGVSSLTSYVLGQLGIASLPGVPILADPSLRLLSPSNVVIKADDDSGAGLDSSLFFDVTTAGTYTLQMLGVGSLTGSYVLTATVAGAAMGDSSYTVNSASTLVIEAVGGGTDTVSASVSYALEAGSEIELLQTTNVRGKGAINLTGNDFAQKIVGNAGNNVIEGKGGSDELWGGNGNDRFVLGNSAVTRPDGTQIDHIVDYGKGDVVDISQILGVASGINVASGGYLRVTTGGLIQVDVDGGGNNWVTLSTINGAGAVTIRYLSGGTVKDISVSRVADTSSTAMLMAGAVAAAGMASVAVESDFAAAPSSTHSPMFTANHAQNQLYSVEPLLAMAADSPSTVNATVFHGPLLTWVSHSPMVDSSLANSFGTPSAAAPAEFLSGTELPVERAILGFAAPSVMIPSAAMLQAFASPDPMDAKVTGESGRVLADALAEATTVDHLLASLPASGSENSIGAHLDFAAEAQVMAFAGPNSMALEIFAVHQDAAVV